MDEAFRAAHIYVRDPVALEVDMNPLALCGVRLASIIAFGCMDDPNAEKRQRRLTSGIPRGVSGAFLSNQMDFHSPCRLQYS